MLQIEFIDIDQLTPYENNAKKHPHEQVEQIAKSIKQFGMIDPIGVWGADNLIVEGHGRLYACDSLGIRNIPIVRLDHLTDDERKAYTLAHNQTTMNSDWDMEILCEELDDIDLDMSWLDFADRQSHNKAKKKMTVCPNCGEEF